jgi:hypothetical protein
MLCWKRLTPSEDNTFSHRLGHGGKLRRKSPGPSGIAVDLTRGTEDPIMALQTIRRFGITAAMAGLGAVLTACSSQTAPLTLACEPNQRAIVRQVTVNGVAQPQLECSSTFASLGYGDAPAPAADTRFVRTAYEPAVMTQPVAAPRAIYRPAVRHAAVAAPKRSVAKSAVIIGSSAGVGAGVGALVGGKKGAGIGALVGGGGAALWDQITRRR